MELKIATALLRELLAEAAASPTQEVCGLLFGDGRHIVSAQPCRNVAADRRTRFEIDPAALIAAHRAARAGGARVIGHYHSHPTGAARPSPCDAAGAAPDGAIWLILGGGDARAWRAVPDGDVHGRFEAVAFT